MKKIMLITSAYTGAGHRSISDALAEQFSRMPDLEVRVIDGFELMGRTGVSIAHKYGLMCRYTPHMYNAAWKITKALHQKVSVSTCLSSFRFLKQVRSFQPDLILTVHSLFNTMLTMVMRRHGLNIPLVVLQADVVNIHSTWCNRRAYMTICPSREAYEASLKQGMPPEKLKLLRFPVRSSFTEAARSAEEKSYDGSRTLRCLLMGGGDGAGRLGAYAEAVLEHTDMSVTVICGHNREMHHHLQHTLVRRYGERVTILGFVTDMEREMEQSDLLIARGSPNTLLEAVTMNVPVIMIGPLLAQERDNPHLMEKHNLGVPCRSPAEVPGIIQDLLAGGAEKLREIRSAQRAYRSLDAARDIAVYVAGLADEVRKA